MKIFRVLVTPAFVFLFSNLSAPGDEKSHLGAGPSASQAPSIVSFSSGSTSSSFNQTSTESCRNTQRKRRKNASTRDKDCLSSLALMMQDMLQTGQSAETQRRIRKEQQAQEFIIKKLEDSVKTLDKNAERIAEMAAELENKLDQSQPCARRTVT